jgi:nicotinamide mononucleotide transporter
MIFTSFSDNFIELFGALTGIIYVILEVRQITWLWPVGIITSAVYVWVFFTGKLYADMSLQMYYVIISVLGWYWWMRGGRGEGAKGRRSEGDVNDHINSTLKVSRIKPKLAIELTVILIALYIGIYLALSKLTDSQVPAWDALITSLSIIGTWMLARKIYEHWYLWIVVNIVAAVLFFIRGLYPTAFLYLIYLIMSFSGLRVWGRAFRIPKDSQKS